MPHVFTPLTYAELPSEQQEQWEAFVSGPLAETNKKNMVDLVRPGFSYRFSLRPVLASLSS